MICRRSRYQCPIEPTVDSNGGHTTTERLSNEATETEAGRRVRLAPRAQQVLAALQLARVGATGVMGRPSFTHARMPSFTL